MTRYKSLDTNPQFLSVDPARRTARVGELFDARSSINVKSNDRELFSRDTAPLPPVRCGFSYSLNASVLLQRPM